MQQLGRNIEATEKDGILTLKLNLAKGKDERVLSKSEKNVNLATTNGNTNIGTSVGGVTIGINCYTPKQA